MRNMHRLDKLQNSLLMIILTCCLLAPMAYASQNQKNGTKIVIRDNAPSLYIVKRGDTLWDISEIFLQDAWLWPRLWRTNPQIKNPHLIYPGDQISLSIENGQVTLEIARAKTQKTISPSGKVTVKVPEPIRNFDWGLVTAQLNQDRVIGLNGEEYGTVLGNQNGSLLFAKNDIVLADMPQNWPEDQLHAVRFSHILFDSNNEPVANVMHHIADMQRVAKTFGQAELLKVVTQNREIMQGDRVLPSVNVLPDDIFLVPAKEQKAVIIGGIEPREMYAQGDIVFVEHDSPLSVGLLMGVYETGPAIKTNAKATQYDDAPSVSWLGMDAISQPALKVGELVIIKNAKNMSYGYILKAHAAITKGALSGHP